MTGEPQHWWETRTIVIVMAALAMVPLLWPAIPPLIDLPGHMGRYRVELDGGTTVLNQFYDFKWALIGNLGVDLLIIPVSKIFGLELGVKLICMAIPAITVVALLWIAREVHGHIPPTAFFALPLAYGHPFLFGFVNFALSMALALLAFALWLRLARLGRFRLRGLIFIPISVILWVCHTYGWGLLGILAFSAELVRRRDTGAAWWRATAGAGIACVPMSLPIVLMVVWRSGAVSGATRDWFNWTKKLTYFITTLRDRWMWVDLESLLVLIVLILAVLTLVIFTPKRTRPMEFSRNLGASAVLLAATFLLLPRIIFGSAFADMRLTPYMFAIAIVGIRMRAPAPPWLRPTLAVLGVMFFLTRMTTQTASFVIASNDFERALPALDHVPVGARLVSFVGDQCKGEWGINPMEHLPGLAIVRRRAFSNDQWEMAGAQLLTTRPIGAGYFRSDPSQHVTTRTCPSDKRRIDWALAHLPRATFDYVWLISPPPFDPRGLRGMTPIWRNGTNMLLRIDDRRMGVQP